MAKTAETKEQKMKRIGSLKVNKALKALQGVGSVARYEPNAAQTTAAFNVIKREVESALMKWQGKVAVAQEFQL